ncbi:hypothetical protein [Paenibacillus sp. ISL-20]|uniref:hypothetical protein n=1 Tax=Paenibacillus sp. ISL-20 TaxID=2819163 RepID=UPI001BEC3542|nr:hypothetical protein [Paenibacillus sp. ISL-20]MBT2759974.1 hypothetical protein [Paenibacillus sp. ISL-20]
MGEYKLVAPDQKDRNKFVVTVVADSNDADYITTINTYTKPFFEETIVHDLIDLLKNYSGRHKLRNYDGEYEDLPYNPNDEYGRCHTLESIKVKYVDNEGFTWNVELAG